MDKSDPSVIPFSEIQRCQHPHSTQFFEEAKKVPVPVAAVRAALGEDGRAAAAGPYRLRERLGGGSFGEVAHHRLLQVFGKFLAGSFSALSKRNFARKYAFDSIFQALQDLHPFAPLQSQIFG